MSGGFTNPIIGGGGTLVYPSIHSPGFTHGVSGWTINKDGSAEFNDATVRGTISAATIIGALVESAASGRRTTIDANGDIKVYNASGAVLLWFVNSDDAMFFYADTGSAAQGALVCSIANAAGTDPFGTAYVAGTVTYVTVAGQVYAVATGEPNTQSIPALFFQNQTTSQFVQPFVGAGQPGSGTQLVLGSGQATGPDSGSAITLEDSRNSGVQNGQALLQAGKILLGLIGGAIWDDNNSQFGLPAGGGPFIPGETFHTVSNGTNFTGTMRVKLLPWNAVWLDIQITYTAAAAVTANFGSLPSASYYPTGARQFVLSSNVAPTAVSSPNRVFISTSGAVQVIIPQALAAVNAQLSLSVMYPTN